MSRDPVKRERVTCRLPRSLVEQLDDYIEEHPWMDRSAVVGAAVADLIARQLSPMDLAIIKAEERKRQLAATMGAKPHD